MKESMFYLVQINKIYKMNNHDSYNNQNDFNNHDTNTKIFTHNNNNNNNNSNSNYYYYNNNNNNNNNNYLLPFSGVIPKFNCGNETTPWPSGRLFKNMTKETNLEKEKKQKPENILRKE